VWCILGVGKQGWGCDGDGWMDAPEWKGKEGKKINKKRWRLTLLASLTGGGMDAITRFAETTRNRSSRNAEVSSLSYFGVQRGAQEIINCDNHYHCTAPRYST